MRNGLGIGLWNRSKPVKATKIQSTILTRTGEPELSARDKWNLIERLNREAQDERPGFYLGLAASLDNTPREAAAVLASAMAADDLDNVPAGTPGKTQTVLRNKAQTLVAVPFEAIR